MSDCQVVFYGELAPGQDAAVVRKKVAALFKASESQIAAFFSGNRVVVKSGIPAQKAEQYRAALAKAGAVAHIEGPGYGQSAPAGGAAAAAKPQSAAPKAPAPPRATPATASPSTATTQPAPPAKAAPQPQASQSIPQSANAQSANTQSSVAPGDDVGRAVVEQVNAEKLGQMQGATLAPTGATLGQTTAQAELNLDLSHISLSDVGSDLQDSYDDVPPSNIDTSHLSLD